MRRPVASELAGVDAGTSFLTEPGTVRRHRAAAAGKFVAKGVLVVDVGVNLVKSWQWAQSASLVSLRAEDDPQRHGRRREETHGGLGLRRGGERLSGPGAPRQGGRLPPLTRARMGR